jgi:hypothetical protein
LLLLLLLLLLPLLLPDEPVPALALALAPPLAVVPFLKIHAFTSTCRGSDELDVFSLTIGSTLTAHRDAVLSSRRHRLERRYSPVSNGTMVVIWTSSWLMTRPFISSECGTFSIPMGPKKNGGPFLRFT